ELLALPKYSIEEEDGKPSFMAIFKNLDDRAAACKVLSDNGIRYRTGKTVVPFRISGNAKWGAPIPSCDGVEGLTFWVWPESLWAPISFTMAALENRGENPEKYKDFWCDKDAQVYQFIGEDNIYFYGVAQTGLFLGLQGKSYSVNPENGKLRLTNLVANHHLLFGKKKASSSGEIKPPKADELLDYYTAEQLRMHFINASLAEQSVGFEPLSVLRPEDVKKGGFDTVLYEGNLLTNVYNRLVRSCFYTVAKHCDGILPDLKTSAQTTEFLKKTVLEYEQLMYKYKFDKVFELLNIAIKDANKIWARDSKKADAENDAQLRRQLLVDSFSIVRTMAVLLHPFAPMGCETVREYLGLSEDMYDWAHIFDNIEDLTRIEHKFKTLEPKFDFFAKHPNQIGG
ncbi:MAG: class I tRNA ligase family protein, partial [Oscillospiraceae bacterium]|nr:class I tRNA ligase family protein [Candidatus Equicaccousia limihippi]